MSQLEAYINDDFLLGSETALELYHGSAEAQPIIDYHCHLDPRMIAENYQFADLTEIWLGGDHYKWRALRANGVHEEYITGDKPSWEKFQRWAETMPYLMRNPLYQWTHLELARAFGIRKILKPETAREIYDECNAKLQTPEFRAQGLMRRFNVAVVCTTDDPADDLHYHRQIAAHPFGTKVIPAWRPDKAMAIDDPVFYKAYLRRLGEASDMEIDSYTDLQEALQKRHDYFAANGCRLSDHGIDTFFAADYTPFEIELIFKKVLLGKKPGPEEIAKFRSAFLYDGAVMDAESGWAQQFHIGPIRNNFTKMYRLLGPDTGYDGVNDLPVAQAGMKFLDRLASEDHLAKTILYNLNEKDNEVLAVMAATFNDGSVPGKMQLGSGWWFLDQEDGIRRQLNTLSNQGLLSRFVGMLTDSRSFQSYPRHEYFRRILCDVLGADVESGRLPRSEMSRIHGMVQDISYYNAERYFGF